MTAEFDLFDHDDFDEGWRKPTYEELLAELQDLRIENARLRAREKEFSDFVDATIKHQEFSSRQMVQILLTPGVTESLQAGNFGKAPT